MVLPSLVAASSAPSLASSPPARSSAVPIRRAGTSSRQSTTGAEERRLSFSVRTPVFVSVPSDAHSGGKPPAGPAPVKQVGFNVAMPAPGTSPAKRAAQAPSLLSQALSNEVVHPSLELFGSRATPSTLAALQHLASAPLTFLPDVPMAPLEAAQAQHPAFLQPVVITAYQLAARAHAGQMRKNGEPVLTHCIETALIVAQLGLPDDLVATALLADVLSDTPLSPWHLEEHVPRSVTEAVAKVTRLSEISQLYRDNTHTLEAEAVLEMLTSMSDVGALLVKLAGRLHNMRTIEALPRCKQVRMATETLEVFVVLANRLGAWAMKSELEDLAFKALHPEEYAEVAAAVAARAGGARDTLATAAAELKSALEAAGLEAVDVSGRAKSMYGVWKKATKSGVSPGEVLDLLALRVVVPAKHDCYSALRVVDGLWAPLPGRCKDYIRAPKGNGYQSLHTTVRRPGGGSLEVQIRTPKMHYIAEYGFAAHWRYKEKLGREDLWLDRLVQWKKWVASEKLGIADGKVRAVGSPMHDQALAALGVPMRGAYGSAGAAQLDPLLQHERFRVHDVSAEGSSQPIKVLVSGPRGVRLQEVPAGTTVGQFMAAAGCITDYEALACELSVNGVELGGSPSTLLITGDQVTLRLRPRVAPAVQPPAPISPREAGMAEMLDVYRPGRAVPVRVALEQKLRLSTMQLRMPASVAS